jgi:hypothetical protein
MSRLTKGFTSVAMLSVAGLLASAAANADVDGAKLSLKSAGQLAFAPNGVLLVGDTAGSAVFAYQTGDLAAAKPGKIDIPNINAKIAALLATSADQVSVQDIAVNPKSGVVYISVMRGIGPSAQPAIVTADRSGALAQVDLAKLKSTYVKLIDTPSADNQKAQTITDLNYVNGRVIVAGLSNEEFSSGLRTFAFPFKGADKASQIEMYHGNHGRFETNAPVRTFVPYTLDGQPSLIAAYTCTPLVKIPLSSLKPGAKVKATTIAELGNMNRPIDMVTYMENGRPYLLMANSARGVMQIDMKQLAEYSPISSQVGGMKVGKGGTPYRTLQELKDVQQLDRVDDKSAVILVASAAAKTSALQTIAMP